jgi:hypothetical protein
MSETDDYILQTIRTWVWSGFYSPDQVDEMIDDLLEEGSDETMLRAAVGHEFAAKAAAERVWPPRTDCDRLNEAFASLQSLGVIALQNAGMTMSDGISDVSEVLHRGGLDGVMGYCFYHGQDLERAVAGNGLMIAFGAINEGASEKAKVGRLVKDTLECHGFVVTWNGDPEMRLRIPDIDWKRRGPGSIGLN